MTLLTFVFCSIHFSLSLYAIKEYFLRNKHYFTIIFCFFLSLTRKESIDCISRYEIQSIKLEQRKHDFAVTCRGWEGVVTCERLRTKSQVNDRKPDDNIVSNVSILADKQRRANRAIAFRWLSIQVGAKQRRFPWRRLKRSLYFVKPTDISGGPVQILGSMASQTHLHHNTLPN